MGIVQPDALVNILEMGEDGFFHGDEGLTRQVFQLLRLVAEIQRLPSAPSVPVWELRTSESIVGTNQGGSGLASGS